MSGGILMDNNAIIAEINAYYEMKYANYIAGLDKHKMEELLNKWYKNLKIIYPERFYGFGRSGVKDFVGGICLAEVIYDIPEVKEAVMCGALSLVKGLTTPNGFSDFMDDIIEVVPVSTKLWNETYRHFDENYRWLERHEFSIGEIAY